MSNFKLFRYVSPFGPRLGVATDEAHWDLTVVAPAEFASLATWLALPDPVRALNAAADVAASTVPLPNDLALLPPIDAQEVWAAGVTYERSKVARQEESKAAGGGDFYDRVYHAERPELFFKSAGWRVAGDGATIRIRSDSTWNVPEPEMTLVLSAAGAIVGVTIGNDVSSRSIEGENPLYLPQAKSYDGACAIGPSIWVMDDPALLRDRRIQLQISRAGESVFSGETSTARLHRTPEDLVHFLFRELSFPSGAFLMTGTGLIPPDSFTLEMGDTVAITLDGVGTLTNLVT